MPDWTSLAIRSAAAGLGTVVAGPLGLEEVRAAHRWDGFDDWFANWKLCLESSDPLGLPDVIAQQLAGMG